MEAMVGTTPVEAAVGTMLVEAAVGTMLVEAAVGTILVGAAVGTILVEAVVGTTLVEARAGTMLVEAMAGTMLLEGTVGVTRQETMDGWADRSGSCTHTLHCSKLMCSNLCSRWSLTHNQQIILGPAALCTWSPPQSSNEKCAGPCALLCSHSLLNHRTSHVTAGLAFPRPTDARFLPPAPWEAA